MRALRYARGSDSNSVAEKWREERRGGREERREGGREGGGQRQWLSGAFSNANWPASVPSLLLRPVSLTAVNQ